MSRPLNLINERIGNLTVIKRVKNNIQGNTMWLCRCDCGKEFIVCGRNLSSGKTKRCRECAYKYVSEKNKKHGMCGTRIYRIYRGMMARCHNPNRERYVHYGARGIDVAEEWQGEKGFDNFYEWAQKNGYNDALTIDRINVDGNYSPDNCRWADVKTQANNQSRTRIYEVYGEKKSVKALSDKYGINYYTLISRLNRGIDIYKALNLKEVRE